MKRLAELQLIGPAFVFVAILAAEGAALGLAHDPTSAWLWYLNLRVFGLFQQAHYVLDSLTGISASGLLFVALPALTLGCSGLVLGNRIMVASASHVSFVYAIFLFCAWNVTHPPAMGPTANASLNLIVVPRGPDLYLLAMLFGASLISAWISHIVFVRRFRSGR